MATPSSPSRDRHETVSLDHIAVAVERWADAWPRYVHQLGGRWHSGGVNVGFSPAQLTFGNGAKIEVLQPWEPEHNPFLRRFLDHSGPGPHHMTFKVPDINAALAGARQGGFEPVGIRLEDPQWQEAFLHPRQAFGVVVQVAQAEFDWLSPAPEGFPSTAAVPAASLTHVTHGVAELEKALTLFRDLLAGHVTGRALSSDGAWEYADLAWSGPLVLRLVAPTPEADASSPLRRWIGDRLGRVHHLAFDVPGSETDSPSGTGSGGDGTDIPGVLAGDGAVRFVDSADNLGTGLVLRTNGGG